MKDMIKRIREEREGFTLAELLIVVAIIAVLVAIAIPVFNSQLESSREAVDVSNLRSAYAQGQVHSLTDQPTSTETKWFDPSTGELTDTFKACGKGTATKTNTTYDLPAKCTYSSDTDVTSQGIKVVYDKTGVTSVAFSTNA